MRFPFDKRFSSGDLWLLNETKVNSETLISVGNHYVTKASSTGVAYPDYLRLDATGKDATVHKLISIIQNAAPGITEICIHPGYTSERQRNELQILLEPKLLAVLRSSPDIELVNFGILGK